jgi:dihydrolipoamide dehydrogenase
MSMKYDVVIIGGGPGGYVAAIKSAQLGGRVLLVEKEQLGGVCLNKGCIPTKTLLRCSGLYKTIQEAGRFGIGVEGVTLDFAKMMGRKREVVSTLVNGIKGLLKANGVDVVKGEGKILDASRVQVHDRIYEAGNIILATGSKPFIPGIKGSESPHVMDSDALLSMEKLPSSIAIIGGGVIGVEFAVLLSELGCKVTILEMM